MKNSKRFYLLLILGLLTAIGPFSIDMYLPAFPDIAVGLDTTVSRVMLSLSSFFIGISVGQFIYGPLLERYGRKFPLYIGLSIYFLASLACAVANSADALIAFRFLQAIGGCAGMVAARAIVRDLFEVHENAKIFSTLMLVVAVSPIIAPTVGGYVTAAFGWRWVFVALMLISLIVLAGVYFFLPESKQPDPDYSLRPTAILNSFWTIFKLPQFYTYAFTAAVAYGGLTAYISGSPYVFMEVFKVTEKQYGWIFAAIAIGIISASQLNKIVLRTRSSERIVRTALSIQSVIGVLFAVTAMAAYQDVYFTMLMVFLFLCCQGFIFPNASALCMAPFSRNAGTASALMGGIQMAVGASASAMVSMLHSRTIFPMSGVMASCSLLALSILFIGRRIITVRAKNKLVDEEDVEMVSTL